MPFVRIDVPAGTPAAFRADLSEAIQRSLHDALGVPMEERFHVIVEHQAGGIIVDPSYLGVQRSPNAVIIQVVLNRGRDAEKKKRFYAKLAEEANARTGIRREDIVVNLIEVGREDWSFGNGEAQLA